jgi:hypothetical protein
MDRDFRLTGEWRGQSDNVVAPLGFEVNNPWRVCKFKFDDLSTAKLYPDGETNYLSPDTFTTFLVHIILANGLVIQESHDKACCPMIFSSSVHIVIECYLHKHHKSSQGVLISDSKP